MKKFLYIFILLFIVGWAQAQQRMEIYKRISV